MIAEGGQPVTWTKPDDFAFDPKLPLPPTRLALPGERGINVAMADGSVRFIDLSRISEKTLKAAITAAGGETLGQDW
jgi:prepilin-type processing-associated H-X9-DG protein